jgi:glucoamylase
MLNTIKVINELLKVATPVGPAWHRYNGDGYGEHDDGTPFDGSGTGRAWPLLTGEHAHCELAAGRRGKAVRLRRAFAAFANEGGMLPEQIWDAPDLPERELFFARHSGSAMPLVWAQAEYVKLRRSIHEGCVFEMPPQTVRRYQVQKTGSQHCVWRFNHKSRTIAPGTDLRLELLATAEVRWSGDDWQTVRRQETRDTGLGIHLADLNTGGLERGATVRFTCRWIDAGCWEGADFVVTVA